MKLKWRKLLVWTALLAAAALLFVMLLRPVRHIVPTWKDVHSVGSVQFLYPRKAGGVVATGPPDRYFFPLAQGDRVYSGTKQGYVCAYDLDTGALLWKTQLHTKTCSVTFDGKGLIYALGSRVAGKPQVAVMQPDGTVLRRYSLAGSLSGWPAPVVTESGTLIGDDTSRQTGGLRNADLAAYDAHGAKLWQRRLTGFSVMHLLTGYRGDIVCVAHQNRVFSVDSKTGKVNWEFVNPYSPADGFYEIYELQKDKLLVSNSRYLFCLDAGGKELWHRRFPGHPSVCAPGPEGTVYAAVSTTVVPGSLLQRWTTYQLSRGNFHPKFPLPTGQRTFLFAATPEGRVRRLGRLDEVMLLDCIGSEGEIYGGLSGVTRIDP
jgi:outer membrane protein assembly factor BamB